MNKLNVGVIYGGQSAEHEVSINSARFIIDNIDKKKYNVIKIKIEKSGKWLLEKTQEEVVLSPGSAGQLFNISKKKKDVKIDVVFPVLHGPYGEDGTIQGLLELSKVPYVGAHVLGSAVGMDKDIMKRLLKAANIPIANFLVFLSGEKIDFNNVKKTLGLPFFVKPANLGSSVGINKVKTENDFQKALKEAFKYDRKIIIEENIVGREIECSVLGNVNPKASIPGEIVVKSEFYSYNSKYIDENGASLKIPANLTKKQIKQFQNLAIKAFETLSCRGLGRVDFFLKKDGQILVNEINTLPGFTKNSMYPKLWEASGLKATKLIDKLINLALEE